MKYYLQEYTVKYGNYNIKVYETLKGLYSDGKNIIDENMFSISFYRRNDCLHIHKNIVASKFNEISLNEIIEKTILEYTQNRFQEISNIRNLLKFYPNLIMYQFQNMKIEVIETFESVHYKNITVIVNGMNVRYNSHSFEHNYNISESYVLEHLDYTIDKHYKAIYPNRYKFTKIYNRDIFVLGGYMLINNFVKIDNVRYYVRDYYKNELTVFSELGKNEKIPFDYDGSKFELCEGFEINPMQQISALMNLSKFVE